MEVHLYKAINKCRRFEGELLGLFEDQVKIMAGETEMSFALKEISLCKPVIVITEEDLGDDEGEALD